MNHSAYHMMLTKCHWPSSGGFSNLPRKSRDSWSNSHSAGTTEKDLQGKPKFPGWRTLELPPSVTQHLWITSIRNSQSLESKKDKHVKDGFIIPPEDGNTKWKKKGYKYNQRKDSSTEFCLAIKNYLLPAANHCGHCHILAPTLRAEVRKLCRVVSKYSASQSQVSTYFWPLKSSRDHSSTDLINLKMFSLFHHPLYLTEVHRENIFHNKRIKLS